jgi:RNA polymerase sigma factor, sigma-70 family
MQNNNVYFSVTDEYKDMSDEDLIILIKSGNKCALEFLIEKYRELVNMKVSKFFMIGAEKEDIVQEGLIGLFKAIQNYNPDKQNSFKTFANLCVERQLITAIKSSNRQKHMPLNSYLSLNTTAYENDEDSNLIEIFNSHQIEDPLDTITKKEYYESVEHAIDKSLSDFEKRVLNRYMQGESYTQIAEKLDAPVKSIDNAIQRIRKKAIKNMENDA